MIIRKIPVIFMGFVFILSFFYLHQKIQIYVQAYQLGRNYQAYNELVDKKDYLVYNFAKSISFAKVNHWAENNGFQPVEKKRTLALNLKEEKLPVHKFDKLALLYSRFLQLPEASSTALAEEKE